MSNNKLTNVSKLIVGIISDLNRASAKMEIMHNILNEMDQATITHVTSAFGVPDVLISETVRKMEIMNRICVIERDNYDKIRKMTMNELDDFLDKQLSDEKI